MYYSQSKFLAILFLFIVGCVKESTPPSTTPEDELVTESVLDITDSLLQTSDTTLFLIKEEKKTTIKKIDSLLNSTLNNRYQIYKLNAEVEDDNIKIAQLENYVDSLIIQVKKYKFQIKSLQLKESISDTLLIKNSKDIKNLIDINLNLKQEIKKQQEYIQILSDSLEMLSNKKRKLLEKKKN